MTIRAILADDATLFREGLARLLTDAGIDVVGQANDAAELSELVAVHHPDVAVVDVRMPPTHTTEGLVAAVHLRHSHTGLAVLILSQYVEVQDAIQLLTDDPRGIGYLLKQRVTDVDSFISVLNHVAAGGSFIDPEVATLLLERKRRQGPLDQLSDRELEVLQLMAEGRSNQGIIERLTVSPRTVESHVRTIFLKLGLLEQPDDHRRVLAVLTYLRSLDRATA
jgi:DNA-binding NarL/FixJ family response regulator